MKYITAAVLLASGCAHQPMEQTKTDTPVYYQAYDEGWYSDPSINRNMMNEIQSGHSYVVRVVNYRYEVRQVNDEDDDILYTTNEFNDAYDYVVEYSSAHSDLIIYDLKTGEGHEETP